MGQLGPGILGAYKAKIKAKASLQQHGNSSVISSLKSVPDKSSDSSENSKISKRFF